MKRDITLNLSEQALLAIDKALYELLARCVHGPAKDATHEALDAVETILVQEGIKRARNDPRLIAAAPDLLQALHDVDAYLAPEGDEDDVYNYIRAIIKGAISKAQGA